MLLNDSDKSTAILGAVEKEEFERAVTALDVSVLHDRAKKAVIEVQKALKIRELEKKIQDEKKGFFGRIFSKSSSSTDATNYNISDTDR